MATANPAMNEAVYLRAGTARMTSDIMTVPGTALKTAVLLVILLITGTYTWSQAAAGTPLPYGLLVGGVIGGLIAALVTFFAPRLSPVTAPIYAALEGLVLGAISVLFETRYPGIASQAISLTIGVLAVMLFVYATGIIRATERFRIGVVAATGAICLVYLVDMVARMFGAQLPFIHETGPIGIGISVVVVVVAALNLILDFDFIEQGARHQAPKYMEWYGGFSLLVTLVWMYLEILRLLAKLREGGRD
jgi:uncharacterized YccA/Bax inhibitor family protein